MDAHAEAMRYGYALYPFAILAMIGSALGAYGTTGLQQALAMHGPTLAIAFRGLFWLTVTAFGTVTVFAAVFGALYRVLQDVE